MPRAVNGPWPRYAICRILAQPQIVLLSGLQTIRNVEEVCAQALVPFEETVRLDVYGLAAGTYTVDVSGTRETFTLDVDNAPPDTGLPNPASVYCQEQGYLLEIRTDEDGNQYGVCIFPNGSECDEWAFFRGECGPAD